MSRVELELKRRVLQVTGDTLLRAEAWLLLKAKNGGWVPAKFRVDSGTEMTCMPAWSAKQYDLPYPIQPTRGLNHTATGLDIRNGVLRSRVVGMDLTEYVFPCFFIGDPNVPPVPTGPAILLHNLLGLTGVVDKIRLTVEDTRDPAFTHGKLIVEKI